MPALTTLDEVKENMNEDSFNEDYEKEDDDEQVSSTAAPSTTINDDREEMPVNVRKLKE
jgi:hypothetical protein